MSKYLIDLKGIKDHRGLLVAMEAGKNVPFEIKRVYYLTDLDPKNPRGFHAHKNLKQLMFCLNGSCDFVLDDGKTREVVHLDTPDKAILVDSLIWREMHNFSEGCVILVLASEYYIEDDYIRDYQEFKRRVG